jgi:hypothetical protein
MELLPSSRQKLEAASSSETLDTYLPKSNVLHPENHNLDNETSPGNPFNAVL